MPKPDIKYHISLFFGTYKNQIKKSGDFFFLNENPPSKNNSFKTFGLLISLHGKISGVKNGLHLSWLCLYDGE